MSVPFATSCWRQDRIFSYPAESLFADYNPEAFRTNARVRLPIILSAKEFWRDAFRPTASEMPVLSRPTIRPPIEQKTAGSSSGYRQRDSRYSVTTT